MAKRTQVSFAVTVVGPYAGFGLRFSFETDEEELATWLARGFASLACGASDDPVRVYGVHRDPAGGRRITIDGTTVHSGPRWADVIPWLLWRINQDVIGSTRAPVLHAGVVAGSDGAVAFFGRSGSGKSTLTAALVLAGLDYVSDEATAVTGGGRLQPWPKPLALTESSLDVLGIRHPRSPEGTVTPAREHLVPVQELGRSTDLTALPLAAAVLLEESDPTPVRTTAGRLLGALPPHILGPKPLDRRAAVTLAAALRDATCWRMGRADAGDPSALRRRLPFVT